MSALIAVGHIVGAVVVLVAFGIGAVLLAGWESERNQKTALQEASLALGIRIDDLDKAQHQERIIQFAAERYSSELLRNRLSDLCGWIQTGWHWISNLLQAGILLGVIWYAVTEDLSNGVYAWLIIGVALFFWVFSVAFGYACQLLTGRFPGQARQSRKSLAEAIERQRVAEHVLDGA